MNLFKNIFSKFRNLKNTNVDKQISNKFCRYINNKSYWKQPSKTAKTGPLPVNNR